MAMARLTMLALVVAALGDDESHDATHHDKSHDTTHHGDPFTYVYDPAHPSDPLDFAARAVDHWILNPKEAESYNDVWPYGFCLCMENGMISSWYQNASAMYLIEFCSPEQGFVMRTGHLQMRQIELLQSHMTCDTLKLMTYCFSHHAPEALPLWKPKCSAVHYTTPACDVDCSVASRMTCGLSAVAALVAAVAIAALGS